MSPKINYCLYLIVFQSNQVKLLHLNENIKILQKILYKRITCTKLLFGASQNLLLFKCSSTFSTLIFCRKQSSVNNLYICTSTGQRRTLYFSCYFINFPSLSHNKSPPLSFTFFYVLCDNRYRIISSPCTVRK